MHNQSDDDFRESNIKYTHKTWEIDAREAAFILVDFWTTHIIDSHLKRCGEIIDSTIAPLLPVARDATGRLSGFTQAAVEFTADERRGRLFLETLRLLDR